MKSYRLIPDDTHWPFVHFRYGAYAFSGALMLLTLILLPIKGLNFGIDFQGGILIEAEMPGEAADLGAMRASLNHLGLGEVALQTIGSPRDVMVRVEQQPGGERAQNQAITTIKQTLQSRFGDGVNYRRVETVGPKVGADLIRSGAEAIGFSFLAILVYVWFRFEWQFAIGGVIALLHDAFSTVGLYALTGLEFNLTSVAAILTIIGYSINDTVVIYDRVRENLRRHKTTPLAEVIDLSINETLARTIVTSFTVFLTVVILALLGGPVLRGFSIAMIWGVVIGTYSSIYVASPTVLHFYRREPLVSEPEIAPGREALP
ncbi:MAG: protein translocase subunit SecF [Alphaproteobacteria bacterium]